VQAFSAFETLSHVQNGPSPGGFMTLQYQLKDDHYHLYDLRKPASPFTGEHRLRLRTDTVATDFEASTGVLCEHGSPLRIH